MKRRTAIYRGLAATNAFLMLVSMSAINLTFQYDAIINKALGINTSYVTGGENANIYYANDYGYDDGALVDVNIDSASFNVELAEESIVLLRNENSALPLANTDRITIFGSAAVNTGLYMATSPDYLDYVSFVQAMEDAFGAENVNETLVNGIYANMNETTSVSKVVEASLSDITASESTWQNDYNDAAVVVLGRTGSEGNDVHKYSDTDTYEDGSPRHMLDLSTEEEALIQYLTAQRDAGVFSKVIVVISSDWQMELDWLAEYNVDACLLAGRLGSFGCTALGNIMTGKANPSARTADTYASNSLSAPSSTYTGYEDTQRWTNYEEVNEQNPLVNDSDGGTIDYYTILAEGIYVGYKYYETRYEDVVMGTGSANSTVGSTDGEAWDYSDEMVYTFGYGLSYTTFDETLDGVTYDESTDTYMASVTVTNTGDVAGKDVVELYAQTPYGDYERENLVEKASIDLVGYTKTSALEPGASETVTVDVSGYFLASYDENNAKTYILSAGDYYLAIGSDAHDALNNILAAKGYTTADGMTADGDVSKTYTWNQAALDAETYSTSFYTDAEVTNLFDGSDINDYGYDFTYLTRNDWEGTYPVEAEHLEATQEIIDTLSNYDYETPADAPSVDDFTQEADNGLTLVDMIGLDYDDPLWEDFLDEFSVEEMANLITDNLSTQVVADLDVPGNSHIDDENMAGGQYNWLSHATMTRAWNNDLYVTRGYYMGLLSQLNGYDEIWAGASNLHRTPFGGRAAQYYSEDATLSYWTCYYESSGVNGTGTIYCIKHFTVNDQETNRTGLSAFVTEQTLREIYLRAFEGGFAGGAQSTMCSLGRIGTRLAKNYYALLTSLLRGEWGFEGHVTSDGYCTQNYFQNTYEELTAGMDYSCIDTSGVNAAKMIEGIEGGDGYLLQTLRQSAHRNLYVMAQTSRMNGLGEGGSSVVTILPTWEKALIVVNGVTAAAMVVFAILSLVSGRKKEIKKGAAQA